MKYRVTGVCVDFIKHKNLNTCKDERMNLNYNTTWRMKIKFHHQNNTRESVM